MCVMAVVWFGKYLSEGVGTSRAVPSYDDCVSDIANDLCSKFKDLNKDSLLVTSEVDGKLLPFPYRICIEVIDSVLGG